MVPEELSRIQIPKKNSHKGNNGKLLIIGGSTLFHAASLWALEVASRIVDLVHYASVDENNEIVKKLKENFCNGIVIHRRDIEEYIQEDDCILIGPGMVRAEKVSSSEYQVASMQDIEEIEDEGTQTYFLTKYLLQKYPNKKWVIDAGALQMMEPEWIPPGAILTPHKREFERLKFKIQNAKFNPPAGGQNLELKKQIKLFTREYNCVVLHKGEYDVVAVEDKVQVIRGGNAGMTKGGTGDVLAGLVAGLYCKNDAWVSAVSASYINKKAGEELYKEKGYWFNASDLADQIPKTMKKLFL